jgi:hypothetical protein
MPDVRGDLLFGSGLLASHATAGFRDGLFELAGLIEKEGVCRPLRVVRLARRCGHLDVRHSEHPSS